MKRTVLLTILLIFCFTHTAYAEKKIEDILPSQVNEMLPSDSISTDAPEKLLSAFSLKNVLQYVAENMKTFFPDVFRFCAQILFLILLLTVPSFLEMKTTGESYKIIIQNIGSVVLILFLFDGFSKSCQIIEECVASIRVFCDAALPVISTLLITGGKNFGAALFSYGISVSATLITILNAEICLPFIRIYLSLGCCGTIWSDVQFDTFTQMIKKAIQFLIGVVFSLFTLTMSMQSILASASDGIAHKALKAAANSVPFMGNVLSGSIDGALTLLQGTKTAASMLGVFSILAIFIGPAVNIGLQYGAIYLARSLSSLFANPSTQGVLKTVCGAYELLISLFLISVSMCVVCFLVICIGV